MVPAIFWALSVKLIVPAPVRAAAAAEEGSTRQADDTSDPLFDIEKACSLLDIVISVLNNRVATIRKITLVKRTGARDDFCEA